MAEKSSREGAVTALMVTNSESTEPKERVWRVIRGYVYEVCLRLITLLLWL